jgi:hypothetical protein
MLQWQDADNIDSLSALAETVLPELSTQRTGAALGDNLEMEKTAIHRAGRREMRPG